MSYGLDFEGVRYETDHAGNRLKATVPYTMFSALVEFWIAARRAQTASLEARSKPGQYKGSLPVIAEANTESSSPSPAEASTQTAGTSFAPPRAVHDALYADSQWRALMERMPVEASAPPAIQTPISPASIALNESAAEPTKVKKKRHFYREFIASPPAEVATRIECGTYFTRAWREYRGLSLDDVAELYGCDKTTILWHESGKTAPKPETLKKLADIYDAPLDQFTPKPGSDDSPFVRAADTPRCQPTAKKDREVFISHNGTDASAVAVITRKNPAEPRSPAETEYPDAVLASLLEGKSPMLAWRLYRRMTLAALAEQYGGKAGNMKAMEAQAYLRRSTVDKLAPIFHCKPEQLYRPEGMPSQLGDTPAVLIEPSSKKPRERTSAPAEVPAMSEAMERAVTLQDTESRRSRATKNQRLARMQAELSRL